MFSVLYLSRSIINNNNMTNWENFLALFGKTNLNVNVTVTAQKATTRQSVADLDAINWFFKIPDHFEHGKMKAIGNCLNIQRCQNLNFKLQEASFKF